MQITPKFSPGEKVVVIRDNNICYGRVYEVLISVKDAGQKDEYIPVITYNLDMGSSFITGVNEYECYKDAKDFLECMEALAQKINN